MSQARQSAVKYETKDLQKKLQETQLTKKSPNHEFTSLFFKSLHDKNQKFQSTETGEEFRGR